MKTGMKLAALAAVAMLALGCSQRDPAQTALTAAEDALAAVSDQAMKYVPDQYAEVKASLDEARKAFNEERYKDAIAGLRDLPARAEALAGAAAEAKQRLADELTADWARLSGSLPGMVSSIEARLTDLGKMRRLPEGVDRGMLDEANNALAAARNGWSEAGAAFSAGDLEGAVAKARNVESMAQDLMARLDIQPG